jgi:hypothetical protein
VIAIVDDTNIDRDDVTLAQHAVTRNTMNDLLVDRGTDAGRKTEVAEKRGQPAALGDMTVSDLVQLAGRNTRANMFTHEFMRLCHNLARRTHALDFP